MTKGAFYLPAITYDSQDFWNGCKRHELLIQKCKDCGTFMYPPRAGCWECGSLNKEHVKIRGKGIVHTFTIVRKPSSPEMKEKIPFNIVVVELPEAGNVRIVSNLLDCKNEDIYIGMPVELVWDDVTEEVTLPKFRPSKKS